MFTVLVDVLVKEEFEEQFLEVILTQGKNSREKEPGCLQFEVLRDARTPRLFTLYEVYTDEPTFYETHCNTPHFKIYSETTAPWVESKSLRPLTKIWPK